jgi:cyclophilin family peptidyl-prolyl cis-trans isomerase
MITAFIILGPFTVFVVNENLSKPAVKKALPSLVSPSPIQTQTLNIKSSKTSSSSSQAQAITSEKEANLAIIKTSKGEIELTLYPKDAPKTVANFLAKAKSGFYDNLIFHRVEDWVIQGGDPSGNGTGGGNMPVEFNNKPFVIGAVGVASRGDGRTQNDAQFFIVKTDAQFLNGKYTNFGIVTKGMDVVNKVAIGDKILGIVIK